MNEFDNIFLLKTQIFVFSDETVLTNVFRYDRIEG